MTRLHVPRSVASFLGGTPSLPPAKQHASASAVTRAFDAADSWGVNTDWIRRMRKFHAEHGYLTVLQVYYLQAEIESEIVADCLDLRGEEPIDQEF